MNIANIRLLYGARSFAKTDSRCKATGALEWLGGRQNTCSPLSEPEKRSYSLREVMSVRVATVRVRLPPATASLSRTRVGAGIET